MNILITGASGYIGSYFVKNLDQKLNRIIPLVRKLPSYFKEWKEKFDVIECDITNLDILKEKIPNVDCIIHLAAYNDILTKVNPEKALIVNGIGTRNMLELARENHCQLFIYFSTLQVYGKELTGTISIDSPIKTHDDYALTHYIAELYCKMYSESFNMNIAVVRPSNIFGAPMNKKIDRWSLVPLCFCKSAFEENKIVLRSSGKQNRDFISLEFVLENIDFLLKKFEQGFKIYNISSGVTFSIADIAQLVHTVGSSEIDQNLELIFESDLPLVVNNFEVINNLKGSSKIATLKTQMVEEITKIFNLLKIN